GNRKHVDMLGARIDRHDDHALCVRLLLFNLAIVITSQNQDVDPMVRVNGRNGKSIFTLNWRYLDVDHAVQAGVDIVGLISEPGDEEYEEGDDDIESGTDIATNAAREVVGMLHSLL